MGTVGRQGIFNTIVNYTGVVLGFINKSLLFPIILLKEEVGLVELLLAGMVIGAELSQMGVTKIVIRFFPYFRGREGKEGGFISLVFAYTTLGFGLFLLLFWGLQPLIYQSFAEKSELFVRYLYLIPPMVLAYTLFRVFSGLSQGLLKSVVPLFAQQILIRLAHSALLLAYWYGFLGFEHFLLGFAVSHLISPVATLIYLLWLGKLEWKFDLQLWNSRVFRLMILYGLFASLSDAVLVLVNKLDVAMLGALAGEEYSGTYGIAFYLALLVAIPYRSLSAILNPMIARKAREKKFNDIQSLYQKASVNNLLLGGLVMIGIWANIDNFYELTPKLGLYASGRNAALIVSLGILINIATGAQRAIIVNSRYYRFDLLANLIVLLLISVGNYLMIPLLQESGAAISTAAGLLLYNAIGTWYVFRKMNIHPFTGGTFKILLLIILVLLPAILIPRLDNPYLDIVLRSLTVCLIYGGIAYKFRLSEDANQMLEKQIRRFFP